MKKYILFLLIILTCILCSIRTIKAIDRYVPNGGSPSYPTIQEAINASLDGDIIHVAAGSYEESLTVNKSITLLGAKAGIHPAVGTHPTEVAGNRGINETILTNPYPALSPNADNITVNGFIFSGSGGRIINTEADADYFHLTNCIFKDTVGAESQGIIQFGSGHHTNMLIDFNLFQDKGQHTLYFSGGPYDGLQIKYNKFNVEQESVFWAASPLVDGVIESNEFDGTIAGTPGIGYGALNIGQGGNIQIINNWFHDINSTSFLVGIINGSISGNKFERIYPYEPYTGDAFQLWGGEYGTSVSNNVDIYNNEIHYNDVSGAAYPTHGIRLRAPESGNGIDASTINIYHNKILSGGVRNDAFAIIHQGDQSTYVNAVKNYWGTIAENIITAMFIAPVNYSPWCNSDFTKCDFTSGVDDITSTNNIEIYPNPADNFLFIKFNKNENVNIKIFDLYTRQVYFKEYSNLYQNSLIKIDISKLATGLYFIIINTNNSILIKKLIISR